MHSYFLIFAYLIHELLAVRNFSVPDFKFHQPPPGLVFGWLSMSRELRTRVRWEHSLSRRANERVFMWLRCVV
jgi:hypothetical protein